MATEYPPDYDDDVVEDGDTVSVSRTWLVAGIVGIVALLVGGGVGYFLALTAFNQGAEEAVAEAVTQIEEALESAPAVAQAPAAQQAQPPPTPLPGVLDNVSTDDDPALGPEDAPVVIVEFSDFR